MTFNGNSLALLKWNVDDIIMSAYQDEDFGFLQELLDWSKEAHKIHARWHGQMSHDDRVRDLHTMNQELERIMKGRRVPPIHSHRNKARNRGARHA